MEETAGFQERLESLAREDPVGVAELCGNLMGGIIRFSEHFCRACGKKCILEHDIPSRLQYLWNTPVFHPTSKLVLEENVFWECNDDGHIELVDLRMAYGGIHLLIVPGDEEFYEIQDVVASLRKNAAVLWRFEHHNNEIIICEPAMAFLDMWRTKMMVLFLYWITNALGFDK